MEEKEILDRLKNFNGSENFHNDFLGTLITDGVKELCDLCKSYWIISDMSVVLMKDFLHKEDFIVIKIKVKDKSCKIILEDGNNKELYHQDYEYTNFPIREFSIWAVFNEIGTYTFLLPLEY